ncbi:hypothetical protein BC830DRAFT_1084715 [Chytriomyces sp. MP71]|nr:hypothetical protein BC830DRAFT_1084715 [Chytriomyces sp. MP71]
MPPITFKFFRTFTDFINSAWRHLSQTSCHFRNELISRFNNLGLSHFHFTVAITFWYTVTVQKHSAALAGFGLRSKHGQYQQSDRLVGMTIFIHGYHHPFLIGICESSLHGRRTIHLDQRPPTPSLLKPKPRSIKDPVLVTLAVPHVAGAVAVWPAPPATTVSS